jgi:site-specific DNA recombinase
VSQELYDEVQGTMKKNSGRSRTLDPRPEREYLLKGIIRCAYCLMPMWAQTYNSGQRYYREHHGSRGAGNCVNKSGSLPCHVADDQISKIMGAIILPDAWMDRVLAKVQLADEVARVEEERRKAEERLKRLGQVYLDELMEYEEYRRQKRQLEDRLTTLVVPGVDAVVEAGKLLEDLPELWSKADLGERRKILTTMLEAVYVECKEERQIVGIRPKPSFRPLFQIATTRTGSGVILVNTEIEYGKASSIIEDATKTGPCLRWRRGRVDLTVNTESRSYWRPKCQFLNYCPNKISIIFATRFSDADSRY